MNNRVYQSLKNLNTPIKYMKKVLIDKDTNKKICDYDMGMDIKNFDVFVEIPVSYQNIINGVFNISQGRNSKFLPYSFFENHEYMQVSQFENCKINDEFRSRPYQIVDKNILNIKNYENIDNIMTFDHYSFLQDLFYVEYNTKNTKKIYISNIPQKFKTGYTLNMNNGQIEVSGIFPFSFYGIENIIFSENLYEEYNKSQVRKVIFY